ncbi:MAG TPA: hypothetical protein VJ932_12295 [Alkalispirochaeta sp.]|nr:hypothetical protein [Alkalispirochaeta sp.]
MMVSLYRKESDGSVLYVTITDRQQNLFGYPTLTVTSGRDFFLTQEKHFTYRTEAELQKALRGMIDRRLKREYSVLYSYFREERYPGLERRLHRTEPPARLDAVDSTSAAP